jgi:glutamine synthetase type III
MQYETSTTDTKTVQTISDCFQEGVFTNAEIQELLSKSECAAIFKGIAAISAQTKEINSTLIEHYNMLRWGRMMMGVGAVLLVVLIVIQINIFLAVG